MSNFSDSEKITTLFKALNGRASRIPYASFNNEIDRDPKYYFDQIIRDPIPDIPPSGVYYIKFYDSVQIYPLESSRDPDNLTDDEQKVFDILGSTDSFISAEQGGDTVSFFNPNKLKNVIKINENYRKVIKLFLEVSDTSYNIVPSNGNWVLDEASGTITFYSTPNLPSSISLQQWFSGLDYTIKATFYRYEGEFGAGHFKRNWSIPSSNTVVNTVSNFEFGDPKTLNQEIKIRVHGNVAATKFTARSDARLKTNINPIHNSVDIINKLNGVSFNWKECDQTSLEYGFIAQEVEQIIPSLVSTDVSGYKSVDYAKVCSILVNCNKELIKRIEILEKKLNNI